MNMINKLDIHRQKHYKLGAWMIYSRFKSAWRTLPFTLRNVALWKTNSQMREGANLHEQRLCSYVVKSKGHINSLFGAETKKMQYLNKTVQDNGRNVQHLVVPNLMIEPIKEEHSLGAANFSSTGFSYSGSFPGPSGTLREEEQQAQWAEGDKKN